MTVYGKECRDLAPRALGAAGVFCVVILLVMLPVWLARDSEGWRVYSQAEYFVRAVTSGWGPAGIGICLCLLALWVGYDAFAGEAANETWLFLRSQPVAGRTLLSAKLLPRLLFIGSGWLVACCSLLALCWWGIAASAPYLDEPGRAASWTLTHAPFAHAYFTCAVLGAAFFTLGETVFISSCTRHQGIALGLAALVAFPMGVWQYWLWHPLLLDRLVGFVVPRAGVAVTWLLAAAVLALAAVRVGTLRQPGLRV